MGLTLKPITPKKPIMDRGLAQKVEAQLRGWGGDSVNQASSYPSQSPTTYRRTGTLGRNWRLRFGTQGQTLVATVYNNTPYAGYVQGLKKGPRGERQTERMAARGWSSISVVGEQQWRKHGPKIRNLLKSAGYRD